MQFQIDFISTTTHAYYIVRTVDFEYFHVKFKSYKGYQSYVPEEIEFCSLTSVRNTKSLRADVSLRCFARMGGLGAIPEK